MAASSPCRVTAVSYTHLDVYKRQYMDIVDDDEELLTVGKVFEERLRAMYDIDDDDVEGQPS